MKPEDAKFYLKVLADEINVKEIKLSISDSDQGPIELIYTVGKNEFYWTLNGERVRTATPKLNEYIPKIIDEYFKPWQS